MDYTIESYLNVVKGYIKNKKLHEPICAELESHLRDAADFYAEIGYDEETAHKKAFEDMGQPSKIGFTLSKLHDVSDLQKILIGIYIFLTVIKILDAIISGSISSVFFGSDYLNAAFPFFVEFLFMVVFFVCGLMLAVSTNRKSPAVFATILAITDYRCIWVFSAVSVLTVKGKLEDFISAWRMWDFEPNLPMALSYVVSGVIILILLALAIGTFITVSKPFASGKIFKTIFAVVSAVLVCVSAVFTIGVYSHINSRDKSQYEVYSKTVSDAVDLLQEMQSIEAEDIDKVIAHFDYLTFEMIRDEKECTDCYYAILGEPTLTEPKLCVDVYDDGTVELYFLVDQRTDAVTFSPFLLPVVLAEGGGRWSQSAAAYAIESYIETTQEGDSLDGLFDIIKSYNCDFRYTNSGYSSYDKYSFQFELFKFLVNYKNGYVETYDGQYYKGGFEYA